MRSLCKRDVLADDARVRGAESHLKILKTVDDPGLNKPEWDSNCADDAGVRGVRFASRALSASDCAANLTQMGDFRGAGRPCFGQYVLFYAQF